jgi:hypothetical protein
MPPPAAASVLKRKSPGLLRGLCARRVRPLLKKNVNICCRFSSSHVIGAGASVVLIRRIQKKLFGSRSANTHHFPKIRHLTNIGFAQSASNGSHASTWNKRRAKLNKGDAQCSWGVSRVLVVQNAKKKCHCGSSSRKDPVSIRRPSNARNAMTPKSWWCRSPLKWTSLLLLRHQRRYRRPDRQDRLVRRAACAAATGYEGIMWAGRISRRRNPPFRQRNGGLR